MHRPQNWSKSRLTWLNIVRWKENNVGHYYILIQDVCGKKISRFANICFALLEWGNNQKSIITCVELVGTIPCVVNHMKNQNLQLYNLTCLSFLGFLIGKKQKRLIWNNKLTTCTREADFHFLRGSVLLHFVFGQ